MLPVPESVSEIAAISPTRRTPAQARQAGASASSISTRPQAVQEPGAQVAAAQHERDQYYADIPTVMVMQDRPAARHLSC